MKIPDSYPSALHIRARFRPRVAIVGAGFSGTLLAINLLEQPGVDVTLIDGRAERIGCGVAYSANHFAHVLNVRAANMSAFADRQQDFAQWLDRQGLGGSDAFVPRSVYGAYLADTLKQAEARHAGRLTICHDTVVDIALSARGASLGMSSGALIHADRVVLAVGNLPPHDPPGADPALLGNELYQADPWQQGPEAGLNGNDPVLVLGTGLTAIDIILRLADSGFSGPIVALSRRGMRPHGHVQGQPKPAQQLSKPAQSLSAMVRWVRLSSADTDWRQVVDSLRPITQLMWSSADIPTRARFLRHLRPYWDIHRHRLAPSVAARIADLGASGQLQFVAGKIAGLRQKDHLALVNWRPRGSCEVATLEAQRIYNCTGPQGDLLRTSDPLLRRLLAAGLIRPDALRLGFDVDRIGRVIGRSGTPSEIMRAVGPITRGDLWEVVAVPDIRHQVAAMARQLTQAHWLGGEGL